MSRAFVLDRDGNGTLLPTRGHLAESGGTFGFHNLEMPLACGGRGRVAAKEAEMHRTGHCNKLVGSERQVARLRNAALSGN